MKYLVVLSLLALLVIIPTTYATGPGPKTAQENDPRTSDEANACFIGGTWAGKCDHVDVDHNGTVESWETDLIYTAGWYLIRYEAGLISRENFPAAYVWALPPKVEVVNAGPSGPVVPAAPSCYNGPGNRYDIQYSGTPNVNTNLIRFSSTDGTCTGTNLGSASTYYFVDAPGNCPLLHVYTGTQFGFLTLPGSLYICTNVSA